MRAVPFAVTALIALAACGSSSTDETASTNSQATATPATDAIVTTDPPAARDDTTANDQPYPDVIGATAVPSGDTWTVSATLSSPYDTPERYADAWRVIGPDGAIYAERILTHDHADEQPFTRSQSGVEIPAEVTEVTIEGRDLANGYGGSTFVLTLDR